MSITGWIGLGLLAVVLLWAIAAYNRLVQLRNRIANAFGQIDVQLKRRHDLVPNLVAVARGYLQHESATLEAVIQARSQAQSAVSHAHRRAPAGFCAGTDAGGNAQRGRARCTQGAVLRLRSLAS